MRTNKANNRVHYTIVARMWIVTKSTVHKSDLATENLHDEQKSTQQPDSIQPKLEQEYWWDVAKVTSRDFEIEQLQLRSRLEIFKIIFKLFAYVVFFMIV